MAVAKELRTRAAHSIRNAAGLAVNGAIGNDSALALFRSVPGCRVLACHDVPDADRFEQMLERLAGRFRFVHPSEAFAPASGEGLRALLTFDDGYASTVTNGLPALCRLGVPAVMFV